MASKGKTLRLCFKEIQHELFEYNKKNLQVISNSLDLNLNYLWNSIVLDNNERFIKMDNNNENMLWIQTVFKEQWRQFKYTLNFQYIHTYSIRFSIVSKYDTTQHRIPSKCDL